MREIKFRGKRLDDGEWIYGYYGYKEASDQHFIMVETMNLHHDWTYFTDYEVDPETVGQCTGLKDKNGKEIYEGDIVQFYRHSDITHRHEKTDVSIIRFYLGSFVFDAKHVENRPLCNLWRPGESMEVIGNIYEHPHLLKGEENA